MQEKNDERAGNEVSKEKQPSSKSPIQQIGDELGRIFRHMLPGIVVLLAARLSHPSWFPQTIEYSNSWQLLSLAVIAIAAGNIWYVFHRYSLHQLLDWIFLVERQKE